MKSLKQTISESLNESNIAPDQDVYNANKLRDKNNKIIDELVKTSICSLLNCNIYNTSRPGHGTSSTPILQIITDFELPWPKDARDFNKSALAKTLKKTIETNLSKVTYDSIVLFDTYLNDRKHHALGIRLTDPKLK